MKPIKLGPRSRRVLRFLAYPSFFAGCFVSFLFLTFPMDRVKAAIIEGFNSSQGGENVRLEIEDVSFYWLTGVEADGVRIITVPPLTEEGKQPPDQVYTLEHVYGRLALASLFVGPTVDFGLDDGNGKVTGTLSLRGDSRSVAIEARDFGLDGLPVLAQAVGMPLGGALSGEASLELPKGRLGKADGQAAFSVEGLRLGDGKAKIMNAIALPAVNAGRLEFRASVKGGRAKVEELSANGPDLILASDGTLRLSDPVQNSAVDLQLTLRFTDQFRTKNETTKAIFGDPAAKVPGLFDMAIKSRASATPDGGYAMRVTGLLRQPVVRKGSAKGVTGRPRPGGHTDEAPPVGE